MDCTRAYNKFLNEFRDRDDNISSFFISQFTQRREEILDFQHLPRLIWKKILKTWLNKDDFSIIFP